MTSVYYAWDWAVVNSVLRLALTMLLTYKIIKHGHQLIPLERVGMGMMGGGGLLSVPVIMGNANDTTTPFDGWSTSVLTIGALLYFSGRLTRHIRHERNNKRAAQQARDYLASRGKYPYPPQPDM